MPHRIRGETLLRLNTTAVMDGSFVDLDGSAVAALLEELGVLVDSTTNDGAGVLGGLETLEGNLVRFAGKAFPVPETQWLVLDTVLSRGGVASRDEIIDRVWGASSNATTKDGLIDELRRESGRLRSSVFQINRRLASFSIPARLQCDKSGTVWVRDHNARTTDTQ